MTDAQTSENKLVDAAKAIGRTMGKVAHLVGAGHPEAPAARRTGKLPKTNKHRLPRRQKKAKLRSAAKRVH